MSFNEITCSFEIEFTFTKITLKNVEQKEMEDVELELIFLRQNVKSLETSVESSIVLSNGFHDVDVQFRLVNDESELTNEEFNFHALGNPLKVILMKRFDKKPIDTRKSTKKREDKHQPNLTLASGSINLLQVLKQFQNTEMKIYHVTLDPMNDESFEICLQFQINFANVPIVTQTLALDVSQFVNFELEPDEVPEVAFHFPVNNSCYRTAAMHRTLEGDKRVCGYIVQESLKNLELPLNGLQSSDKYFYENILSDSGFDFLGKLITQNSNLLVEIKTKKQSFMALIDLQVFNYEGVKEAKFLIPIYYLNKKMISETFLQDLNAFPEDESDGKKKLKKSSRKEHKEDVVEDSSTLVPLLHGDENEGVAMMMIKLKISHSHVPETPIEDLIQSLNRSFSFIEDNSFKDQVAAQSEKNFVQAISDVAKKMENFIDENSDLDTGAVRLKIQDAIKKGEIFDRKQLKEAIKDVIGNKLNADLKTETNHEFKISMIKAFKELSQDMMCILYDRDVEKLHQPPKQMPISFLRVQAEEWMMLGQKDKAEAIYLKCLDLEPNTDVLINFSVFLWKNNKFQECAERVLQLLKIDNHSLEGFYLLAYLMTESKNIEVAILCLRILIKIQPNNLEFWIILMMLYVKKEDKQGANYCSLNMTSLKFITNSICASESLELLELNTRDDLAKVLNHQLKCGLLHFVDFTREFMSLTSKQLEDPFVAFQLNVIELALKEKLEDVGDLITTVELTDLNEPVLRIFKGNWLYETGKRWEAVCEYEIAFNLCLNINIKFPCMLTFRCGDWFIKAGILNKARRYFHHACKISPTFNTWMGLGTVCYQEANYLEAEKYFNEANKIDNKSGDNWIHLALCNFHLHRQDSFEKCFQIARNFDDLNYQLMENAEKILGF